MSVKIKDKNKKSLADVLGGGSLDPDFINKALAEVHGAKEEEKKAKEKEEKKKSAPEEKEEEVKKEKHEAEPKPAPAEKKPAAKKKKEIWINVQTPTPMKVYLKAKEAALLDGHRSMKNFFLHCVEEHLRRQGYLR